MIRKSSSISAVVNPGKPLPFAAIVLVLVLLAQPLLILVADAQGSRRSRKMPQLSEEARIAHVLSRLTFGARPEDFARVKAMGVEAFIAQQLEPDSFADKALQLRLTKLPTLNLATPVLIEQYTPPKPVVVPSPSPVQMPASTIPGAPTDSKTAVPATAASPGSESMKTQEPKPKAMDQQPAVTPSPAPASKPTPQPKNPQMVVTELQRAALLRAVYSERQLFEMMVSFWENHFSIFANKDDDRYLMTSYDRDTIRPFAMGRFRDLLGATAHSPAMLFYLDNWRSSVPRPYPAKNDKPAGVDGGINENYARELLELHTMGVDGGYTQQDVQEVARCFTGWTIQKPNEQGLFLYRPGLHDNGEKLVLGHKILAGGLADGERVLDILAAHPATAHFIASKLARRFISDDPPPAVIEHAAEVFLKTDGSIRETLRAIITAPEFSSPEAQRAKIRSPFEYIVAALRALNAETDVDAALLDWTRRMGQPLFLRVTPDGYSDRAEQWLSAGALLERFNFAFALANNKIKGTRVDLGWLIKDGVDITDSRAVADHLTMVLLTGDLTEQTRAGLAKITKEPTLCAPTTAIVKGVDYKTQPKTNAFIAAPPCITALIAMIIGSPEYQRR